MLAPERNAAFLIQCVHRFRVINFADQATGRIYLRMVSGGLTWADRDALAIMAANPDTRAGLMAAAPSVFDRELPSVGGPLYLQTQAGSERAQTLGAWGTST
jgi:hypothetical protein